jgi:hypothetical protein
MAREMISFNPDSSYTWILLDRLARAAAKDRLYQSLHASGGDADRLLYYHTLLMLAENDLHKRSKRIDELRLGGAGTLNSLERRIANLDLDSDYEDVLRGIEKYFAIGSISRINREIESLPDDENVKKDKFIASRRIGDKNTAIITLLRAFGNRASQPVQSEAQDRPHARAHDTAPVSTSLRTMRL